MTRIPKRVQKKIQDYDKHIDEIRKEMEEIVDLTLWEEKCRKKNNAQIKKMQQIQHYRKKL
jgi:hypothetical protein